MTTKSKMNEAFFLMIMAASLYENNACNETFIEEQPPKLQMVKLKPGQKLFKIENGKVVECNVDRFLKNENNYVLARTKKTAIKKFARMVALE